MSAYNEKDWTLVQFEEPFEYPVKKEGDVPKTIDKIEFVHPNRLSIKDLHSIKSSAETDEVKYIIEAISITIRNAETGLDIPTNVYANFRAFHIKDIIDTFKDGDDEDDPNM